MVEYNSILLSKFAHILTIIDFILIVVSMKSKPM